MGKKFFEVLILLFTITLNGCDHKKVILEYDKSSHMLRDIHDNGIRELSIIEKNTLGSTSCTINYYKKLNANGKSYINLEKPDTAFFNVSNTLNCKMRKGNKYMVSVTFLGQSDSLEIVW